MSHAKPLDELVFKVIQKGDGGYVAQCLTESIVTQGDTLGELKEMVNDAVEAYYFDAPKPRSIRLHLVRDDGMKTPRDLSGRELAIFHWEVSRRSTASDSTCPRSMANFVPSGENRNLSIRSEVKCVS
jgi:hypothetical protein